MKFNISYPTTGCVKTVEVDEDRKLIPFFDKRIGAEVPADTLGDEFKGYTFRITGGNDKQGFPMMQGVLVNRRVRLLFREGMPCYRPRRDGAMRRKSVRGCIVSGDISALNVTIVEKGENEIAGLTDETRPRRLGPKRATRIRKLFNLSKSDDVRKFVVRRVIKEGKKTKAPKIQRLITDRRVQRKKAYKAELQARGELSKKAAEEYKQLMAKYRHSQQQKRLETLAKKKKAVEKKTAAAAAVSK